MKTPQHEGRAHSKFSASGSERWFNCPGSVEICENLPDKSSPWAKEGVEAHEVLERMMDFALEEERAFLPPSFGNDWPHPREMIQHARNAANFMLNLKYMTPDSELLIETKVFLDFIHPEMFGTYDGAVVDYFGTLHVFDFKYGAGHAVTPKENLQMIFYGIGLAHKYDWNFKRVRLWIIQPRIRGYDGPTFWEVPTARLESYVAHFETAVKRVLDNPKHYVEGSWCHWCKAKAKCPLKRTSKLKEAQVIFGSIE